jgi:hypothetical protein
VPSTRNRACRFRVALAPQGASIIVGLILVMATAALLLRELPRHRALLVGSLFTGVYLVLVLTRGVTVSEKGLRLNWATFVSWDQVIAVVPSRVLGLRYLRIYRRGKRFPWWFPLDVVDETGLQRAILECAPRGNAFRGFFEPLRQPDSA